MPGGVSFKPHYLSASCGRVQRRGDHAAKIDLLFSQTAYRDGLLQIVSFPVSEVSDQTGAARRHRQTGEDLPHVALAGALHLP